MRPPRLSVLIDLRRVGVQRARVDIGAVGGSQRERAMNRSMTRRAAGSLVRGVRSSGRGTRMFPFTLPRIFCWPALSEKNAPFHNPAPQSNP